MRVTGKAKIERKYRQVRFAIREALKGKVQPQTVQSSMQSRASLAAKYPRKMKRRTEDGSCQFMKAGSSLRSNITSSVRRRTARASGLEVRQRCAHQTDAIGQKLFPVSELFLVPGAQMDEPARVARLILATPGTSSEV